MIFEPGWQYRLPLYVILGIVCEVLFTATTNLINPKFLKSWNVFGREFFAESPHWRLSGRDPRAVGYSFLWMIPIYALLIFIEPWSQILSEVPFFLRGSFYVLIVWIAEYSGGFLIKAITGRCPWDYSHARWNFHGFIRWDFFPFWFVFMLLAEWFSRKFILLTPAIEHVFAP